MKQLADHHASLARGTRCQCHAGSRRTSSGSPSSFIVVGRPLPWRHRSGGVCRPDDLPVGLPRPPPVRRLLRLGCHRSSSSLRLGTAAAWGDLSPPLPGGQPPLLDASGRRPPMLCRCRQGYGATAWPAVGVAFPAPDLTAAAGGMGLNPSGQPAPRPPVGAGQPPPHDLLPPRPSAYRACVTYRLVDFYASPTSAPILLRLHHSVPRIFGLITRSVLRGALLSMATSPVDLSPLHRHRAAPVSPLRPLKVFFLYFELRCRISKLPLSPL
uniref:Uncharacterized protein n=1 Tax=Oryza sativa subsp. japonica TaxID=39947 RepID=Q653C4_ORYSJ|nr:hypothetical protein [Oryza sativa Japonica Group]